MRSTHTYATLAVSQETYDEIAGYLRAADYGHAFIVERGERNVIDMHGIGLTVTSGVHHKPAECDRPPPGWKCSRERGHPGCG